MGQHTNNDCTEKPIVPCALLPHQAHILGKSRPKAFHGCCWQSRFVTNNNLRQQRLYLIPVTKKCNMGQASAPLTPRDPLHRFSFCWSLFVHKDIALPTPLEQANGCLVQVYPQDFFARWHFRFCIVVPLPSSQCLTQNMKNYSNTALF